MSFPKVSDARSLTKNLRSVLMRGGLVSQNCYLDTPSQLIIFKIRETPVQRTRVLGQTWCLTDDTYIATQPNPVPTPRALRQLSSLVSSIFYSIGVLALFSSSIHLNPYCLLHGNVDINGSKRFRMIFTRP